MSNPQSTGPTSAADQRTYEARLLRVLIAWARDEGQRAADAVVVFSPQTDATFASPSHRTNLATDIVQRGGLASVVQAPRSMALSMSFLMHRINPRDPLVSPLFGDLSGLPPTLIQASESEMFLDDAVRYANKANAQGSRVILQTWPNTMHGWHAMEVPEADAAFDRVRAFLGSLSHAGQRIELKRAFSPVARSETPAPERRR